jgi:hypothetical protein
MVFAQLHLPNIPAILSLFQHIAHIKHIFIYLLPFFVADTSAQMANRADCIKVASDYMSIDNLRQTEAVVGELRRQHLASAYGDDVLTLNTFYVTLWYAWQFNKILLLGAELGGSELHSVFTNLNEHSDCSGTHNISSTTIS